MFKKNRIDDDDDYCLNICEDNFLDEKPPTTTLQPINIHKEEEILVSVPCCPIQMIDGKWNPDNEVILTDQHSAVIDFNHLLSFRRAQYFDKTCYLFSMPSVVVKWTGLKFGLKLVVIKITEEYYNGRKLVNGESNKKNSLSRKGIIIGSCRINPPTTISTGINSFNTHPFEFDTTLIGHGAKTHCVLTLYDNSQLLYVSKVFVIMSRLPTSHKIPTAMSDEVISVKNKELLNKINDRINSLNEEEDKKKATILLESFLSSLKIFDKK